MLGRKPSFLHDKTSVSSDLILSQNSHPRVSSFLGAGQICARPNLTGRAQQVHSPCERRPDLVSFAVDECWDQARRSGRLREVDGRMNRAPLVGEHESSLDNGSA
jgi:hypothetical protein